MYNYYEQTIESSVIWPKWARRLRKKQNGFIYNEYSKTKVNKYIISSGMGIKIVKG